MEKVTIAGNSEYLRPCWLGKIRYSWKLGLLMMLIICVSRFFLVLQANKSGNFLQ